jgi:Tfp pilus assembly protein PilN
MMDELAMSAPERLWLTGLTTRGTSIEIKGESLDNELVAAFLSALGESPYFDQVDLDGTELGGDAQAGLKLVSFKIQAVLVSPKPPAAVEG